MNIGSTWFLRGIIYLLGLGVLGVCVLLLGNAYGNHEARMYAPLLIGMAIAAVPFLYALYQGLLLLRYIDANVPFSEPSVKALRTAAYCHFAVACMYALAMPYIIYVADNDDAPGVVVVALAIISAFVVIGVFTAVCERLVQKALDIKHENDLTV